MIPASGWKIVGSSRRPNPTPAASTAVAELEDAAGADGARAEHVAGAEVRVARGLRHELVPGVVHVGEPPARALLAVHAGDHLVAELVGGDEHRAERRREVLPLRRAE